MWDIWYNVHKAFRSRRIFEFEFTIVDTKISKYLNKKKVAILI